MLPKTKAKYALVSLTLAKKAKNVQEGRKVVGSTLKISPQFISTMKSTGTTRYIAMIEEKAAQAAAASLSETKIVFFNKESIENHRDSLLRFARSGKGKPFVREATSQRLGRLANLLRKKSYDSLVREFLPSSNEEALQK